MSDQDFLVVLVDRNFLEFSRLLAADAPSGPKSDDVAGLAEIADAIDFSVVDGKDVVHAEITVCLILTFQANFVIAQPLVFECPENILIASGQRDLLCGGFHHGSGPLNVEKLPLQDVFARWLSRLDRTGRKTERNAAKQKSCETGAERSEGCRPRPVRC